MALLPLQKRVLSTVCLYHAINDAAVAMVPVLTPIFREMFNLSYTQIGIISGTAIGVNLVAQLLLGRFSDGRSSRDMLSIGIFLIGLSVLLLTLSTDFYSLLGFMVFMRIGASFFHPIGVGWISRTFRKSRLDWAMGVQSGFADIGAFLALLTTLYIASRISWQMPLYIMGAIALIGVSFGVLVTKDIRSDGKAIREPEDINSMVTSEMRFVKRIWMLLPAMVVSGAGWGMVLTYLPLLFQEVTSLTLTQIGLLLALWVGMGACVSFQYGRIIERLGRFRVMAGAYILFALASFAVAFSSDLVIIILAIITYGISLFLSYPAIFSYVTELTHSSRAGRAFALTFTAQLGGGAVLSFVSGWLADLTSIAMPFVLLGSISFIAALVFVSTKSWLEKYLKESSQSFGEAGDS